MKGKIAIIGSGISGLSIGKILKDKGYEVLLFESEKKPGGLIKCTNENGNLFHRVGGHVFNSKIEKVHSWFWGHFNQENEFIKAKRNAQILIDGKYIGYPIENYFYQLPEKDIKAIIFELVSNNNTSTIKFENFGDFLIQNFGNTLYKLYFEPYNTKIWNFDLKQIPLPWLDGKLPMPNLKEIILNNILKKEDNEMVHSTFFYPKVNGSSFIADRLSQDLDIFYSIPVNEIIYHELGWLVNGQAFDKVIYTGDVRKLENILKNISERLFNALKTVKDLRSNGTSNALCYTDNTDLSWLYLPSSHVKPHRIIYTGNFSPSNNKDCKKTCTVEFSGYFKEDDMRKEIAQLPGNLVPIAFNYEPNSYVIQYPDTREKINFLKTQFEQINFYLLGRFAEWEYYNMDTAINAAMNLADKVSP